MAADTTVKHFHSSMQGAPTLNNTAGSLIAVLDACLVNGFGLQTATSVNVTGGVGTAVFSSTPSVMPQGVALFAGATPASINGEKKVLTVAGNTVTFDATGIGDVAATGTITMKVAPAGWEKQFSGTNLAAYRSLNVQSTRSVLRVDDTTTTSAGVRGYVSMVDVNNGTEPFPTVVQQALSVWPKASSAVNKTWAIVGNDRFFYIFLYYYAASPTAAGLFGFGDINSRRSGDAYRAMLFSAKGDYTNSPPAADPNPIAGGYTQTYGMRYAPRAYSGLGSSISLTTVFHAYAGGAFYSGAGGATFPNPADNGIIFTPIHVIEGNGMRGTLPGIYATPQNIGTNLADGSITQATDTGAQMLWRRVESNNAGGVFFDLTNSWGS